MKKITFLLLLLVTQLHAQYWNIKECAATLGTTTYGPIFSNNSSVATGRFAILYKAADLTDLQGKTLNKIYFKRATATGTLGGNPNLKIYIKEVNSNDLGTGNLDWTAETNTATLVYNANPAAIIGNTSGQKGFGFQTNFNYNNQSLVIMVEYTNTSANGSKIEWNYEFGSPCVANGNNFNKYITSSTNSTPSNTLSNTTHRRPLIGFDYAVSCPRPITPTAVATTNSVNINWTAGGTETKWEYVVVPFASPAPTTGTETTSNNATVTDLTEATYYKLYVRSVCSATEMSTWTEALLFSTNCQSIATVPFTENFETQPIALLSTCTKVINNGSGNVWTLTNNPGAGFNSNTLQYIYSTSAAANTWFFTKGITLEQGKKYKLTFNYGNNFATDSEKLRVSIGTSQASADMTTELLNDTNITGATMKNGEAFFQPTASGVYYLGFQAHSDKNKYRLYVDNINLIEDTTLSSNDFILNKSVVSPNPFNTELIIKNEKLIQNVSIYSVLGKEIVKQVVNLNQIELNTEMLNKGAYILKVQTEEGTQTFKLVKN